jgi:hypothetical protein
VFDFADVDFQVKGDNLSNLIRTEATTNRVAIGFGKLGGEGQISSSLHIGGDLTLGKSGTAVGHITASGNIVPSSDAGGDLGASNLEWKDLYIDGVAYVDTLNADALGANLDHANYNSTNVDINSGDISGVTISGGLTWSAAQDLNNQNLTNVDIDGGDIASGVTINKSPVVNFNSGDVQGSITLTNLASGTGALTIQTDSVEGTMLNTNAADTTTLTLSSDTLSVLKVPNALTAGVGISAGGTFDGAAARTFAIDFNEFSTVTPTDGDFLATLDSDGSTEQNTAISALATLYAGTGLSAASSVMSVDYGTSAGTAAEGDNTLTLSGASKCSNRRNRCRSE